MSKFKCATCAYLITSRRCVCNLDTLKRIVTDYVRKADTEPAPFWCPLEAALLMPTVPIPSWDIMLDVKMCPRCGNKHASMVFSKVSRVSSFTHWKLCPVTCEPILLEAAKGTLS